MEPGALWMSAIFLLATVQHQAYAVGEYSRKVSYNDEIVVRCPDKNRATVQILQAHTDVWHLGKESIDMRISRSAFARVQQYFSECIVIVSDLEAHVQAAERKMFPRKKAEQEAWLQAVVQAMLPKGDLKECEAKIAELEASIQKSKTWFEEYHDYNAIVDWYQNLANDNPSLVTFIPSIGKTFESRDMPCVHFTGSKDPNRKKFYIQCQIHAREWISGAVCMYIAKYFVESYGVNATITDLMDKLEFVLVPFVNPDGYVYTWTTDRLWRKNRVRHEGINSVGVDINRNFPTGFKFKDMPSAEDYGGQHAKSELETQHIINNFRRNSPIVGSIDFHSYGQLLLRPWAFTNSTPPDEDYHVTLGRNMANAIRNVHGSHYTSEHSHDLYYCYGVGADWLYSEDAAAQNGGYRSASFCIELRDTAEGGSGFILPPEQIIPTGEEIVPAVVLYAKTVLENPIKYHPLSQDEVIF